MMKYRQIKFDLKGFFKEIKLVKLAYLGYIKDYEGVIFMGCEFNLKIFYINFFSIIRKQREVNSNIGLILCLVQILRYVIMFLLFILKINRQLIFYYYIF